MSELPNGWALKDLGYIATEITKGTTPTTLGFDFINQGIPFVKVENIINNKINHKSIYQYISGEAHAALSRSAFKVNDVLFSIAGTIGKTALISIDDVPCNTNQAIAIIRGTSELLESAYLRYNLSFRANEIFMANARGGAMNNVSLGDLKKIIIAIPPQAEQTRIVEKLDEVLAQVDTIKARLDGIPAILKRFRQSVLAAAVSGRLTEEWRGNESYSVQCDLLGDLAKFIDYRGKTPLKTESGIPLITAKNIRQGYISREPREYIGDDDYENWMTRGIPNIGDVLITTEAPMGYVANIDITEKFALAQRAICLQFNEKIDSYFASIYMRASPFQQELELNATGSTVKGIKASLLKKIQIQYPSIEEQKEIVCLVDQYFTFADTIEVQVKKAQARVDNLTQSILAKAFRGELVAQDPDDEPAEKLLERIAQARKEAEALAKAAKKVTKTK